MAQDSLMNVPSQIPTLMERLVKVMREKGLVMPDYLNPGLSRQDILGLTQGVIDLPEDVIAFYEFADGVRASPDSYYANTINFGERILTLQESLQERGRFLNELDDDEVTSEWVEETGEDVDGWLPLLKYDSGYSFIDVNRHARNEPCIFSTYETSLPELSYDTLESMLRTIIACYEQDAFLMKDGIVEDANTDQMETITQRHNPGIRVYNSSEVKAEAQKQLEEIRKSEYEAYARAVGQQHVPDAAEREATEGVFNQMILSDRDAAIAAIQEVKSRFPNSPFGKIHIQEAGEQEAFQDAQKLYHQGDWPGAIIAFQQLLVRFPKSVGIDDEIAYVKRRYRELHREIEEHKQLLIQDPQNVKVRYQLGYLLRVTGQTAEACDEWRKIVNEDAGHWAKSAKKMLDKYSDHE